MSPPLQLWYCCSCSFGPYLPAVYGACIICHHQICYNCFDEEIQGIENDTRNQYFSSSIQNDTVVNGDDDEDEEEVDLGIDADVKVGADSSADDEEEADTGINADVNVCVDPNADIDVDIDEMDDQTDHSGEGSTTLSTETSPGPNDPLPNPVQIHEPPEYVGPLLAIKTNALLLLVSAYERICSPESTSGSRNDDPKDNPEKGAATGNRSNCKEGSSSLKPTKRKGPSRDDDEKDDDYGDDDGQNGRRKQRRATSSADPEDEKLLACPFSKVDPRKYRKCNEFILRDISRLKYVQPFRVTIKLLTRPRQHLKRAHQIPIHCSRCSEVFKDESLLREHERQPQPCGLLPEKEWDGVTLEQQGYLQKKVSPKKSREENWYIIFDILFPHACRPESPCKFGTRDCSSSNALADVEPYVSIVAIQNFMTTQGPSLLDDFVRRALPNTATSSNSEINTFINSLFPEFINIVFERFLNADSTTIEGSSLPVAPPNQDLPQTAEVPGPDQGETNPADQNSVRTTTLRVPMDEPVPQTHDTIQRSTFPIQIPLELANGQNPTAESTPTVQFTPGPDEAGDLTQSLDPWLEISSLDFGFGDAYFGAEDTFLDDRNYAFENNGS
jgi:hypothetical protein